jgi:hypothetical protein
MAWPLRLEFLGALYHVTARGNERKPIYRDEQDRLRAGLGGHILTMDNVSKKGAVKHRETPYSARLAPTTRAAIRPLIAQVGDLAPARRACDSHGSDRTARVSITAPPRSATMRWEILLLLRTRRGAR